MAFDLDTFARERPKLYHLTSRSNLPGLLKEGFLHPAAALMEFAGASELIRRHRPSSLELTVNNEAVWVRDQEPLHEREITLEGGWKFDDLICAINQRVFFWPGDSEGPKRPGLKYFQRYQEHECAVLVFDTPAVFAANPRLTPEFSKHNSGAPRCIPAHGGKGSPRGPSTFLPADRFANGWGKVVEVVFPGAVKLPLDQMQVRDHRFWCS